MSAVTIRAILETALSAMSPSLPTAWENTKFTPAPETAHQRVYLLLAQPQMLEMSWKLHRERGFMQVSLCYPLDAGPSAAATRAELIRTTFYAGRDLTSGGITVTIDGTPEIAPAMVEDDFYVLPVKVRFYSHVSRS